MQQQAQFWRNVARTKQNKQQRARRRLVAESLESRLALAAFNDGNLLVTNSPFDQTPMLYEYTVDGQQVQAVPLTHPSGVATERPRRRRRQQVRHPREHVKAGAVGQGEPQVGDLAHRQQLVGADERTAPRQIFRLGHDPAVEPLELDLAPRDHARRAGWPRPLHHPRW